MNNWNGRKKYIQELLSDEPFYDEYKNHLKKLNEIVKQSNEPLEGNLFYKHLETKLSLPDSNYRDKRRNLILSAAAFKNVCEIGFNAGHSALLMLTVNPELHLTSIDLCEHRYTLPCYEYLKTIFEDRIDLIQSHSAISLPLLGSKIANLDFFIIDGGHDIDLAETDLLNVINHASSGSTILFDDAHVPELRIMLDLHILTRKIVPLNDNLGFIKSKDQMFFHVV